MALWIGIDFKRQLNWSECQFQAMSKISQIAQLYSNSIFKIARGNQPSPINCFECYWRLSQTHGVSAKIYEQSRLWSLRIERDSAQYFSIAIWIGNPINCWITPKIANCRLIIAAMSDSANQDIFQFISSKKKYENTKPYLGGIV